MKDSRYLMAFFVGGHQADVGSSTFLGDHPHVAVGGIFRPEVEVQVAVVGHVQHFVLEASDDLDLAAHVKEFSRRTRHTRSVDDRSAFDGESFATPLKFPIGKLIFAIVNSLHAGDAVVKAQFRTLRHGFVSQPALKQVLFEDVAFFGQQFFRAVRKNDANTLDVEGLDVVGKFQVKVLNSQLGQALAAWTGVPISGSASNSNVDRPARAAGAQQNRPLVLRR